MPGPLSNAGPTSDCKATSGFAGVNNSEDARLHQQHATVDPKGRVIEFHRSRHPPGEFEEKKVYNRIFVGGLNETINEDDLRELFGQFGEIKEVQLKDRGAKKDETRRGHGFITYRNKEQAAVALREGKGEVLEIRGVKLNVCQAVRRVSKQQHSVRDWAHLEGRDGRSNSATPGSPPNMPMAPPYAQYPGMMPYPLNAYTLAMWNSGYPMPGYGWPLCPPNPLMYGCSSMSSGHGSDACLNCCDGHSDLSCDKAQSSPPSPERDRTDYFAPTGGRLSEFAKMHSGYISLPEDRERDVTFSRAGKKLLTPTRDKRDYADDLHFPFGVGTRGDMGGSRVFSHSYAVGEEHRLFQHQAPHSGTRH